MDITSIVSVARAAYGIYNKFEIVTNEIYQMKQKIEQLIPVVEAVQILYAQRNNNLFTAILSRSLETLQQCTKLVENGINSFLGLAKTAAFNKELNQLSNELGNIIKELTLAIVAWNALGSAVQVKWTPKIVIVGAPSSGKSSFVLSLHKQIFHDSMLPTIGASFVNMKTPSNNLIEIWDTEGASSFQGSSNPYTTQANIILFFYSIESRNQLETTIDWYNIVLKTLPAETKIALIANKIDLIPSLLEEGRITKAQLQDGKRFAESKNMLYFEVSVKTMENIEYCLFKLFSKLKPPPSFKIEVPEEAKAQISTSGYLHKVPGRKKDHIEGWQERFFVCNVKDKNFVYYYKSNQDYRRNKFAGKINLLKVRSVSKIDEISLKPFSFSVETSTRTWYFYAENNDEMEKWITLYNRQGQT